MSESKLVSTEIIPSYAVLRFGGEINIFIEEDIEKEFKRLIDIKCPILLMDFSDADHINSAGITILVGIAARARDAGLNLAAFGLTEHYKKIFEMVGLHDYIKLGESRDSLLKDLQKDVPEQSK